MFPSSSIMEESRTRGITPGQLARLSRRPYTPKFVPESLKSGHELVDKIGSIQLQGIVIDRNWFKHELFQNEGKPNLTAIFVFGDLVDWYRPIKKRSTEHHGRPFAEKKFQGDYLVEIYARWSLKIGLSPRQIKEAVYFLKERKLIDYREASSEIRKAFTDPNHGNEKPFEIWPIAQMVKEVSACGYIPDRLGPHFRTGNSVCDELFPIKLWGDTIDFNWLHHPALRDGAKNHINLRALFVIAHLFFMYTPKPNVHSVTGESQKYGKWFEKDVLSKDYGSWAKFSGLTTDQLRVAVAFLVKRKLINRWSATEETDYKYQSNLRAMIEVRYDEIFDLTFGPFANETERRLAQEGRLKVRTEITETPSQLPLEGLESAHRNYRDSPVQSRSAHRKRGGHRTENAETIAQKTPTIIGTYPVTPPVTTGNQQQQDFRQGIGSDIGGGGFAAKASIDPAPRPVTESDFERRREAVIARLLAYNTGCSTDAIRQAATYRLEHAEMWAEHWPATPESSEEYWQKRWEERPDVPRSNPGAALLAKRLKDIAQQPASVRAQRIKDERAAAKRERDEEKKRLEMEEKRALDDATAFQRKVATETLQRYSAASDTVRRAAAATVARSNSFLRDRAPDRDMRRLIDKAQKGELDHALLFTLTNELHNALDAAQQENPQFPEMGQSVPGDDDEWEDADAQANEDEEDLPRISLAEHLRSGGRSMIVEDLVERVRSGELPVEQLDSAREGLYDLGDWNAIKERVISEIDRLVDE